MSSNNTTQASSQTETSLVVAYYPFTLIIVGTLLNLFTFFILYRSSFRDTKKQPVIHYMRTIAIFDILMLYGWNFDHYLQIVHGYILLTYSIPTCKIFGFLNYFAAQSSAWLRVAISFERYLSVSRLHRTIFNRQKGVLITIASIITIILLLNLHFIIFTCFVRPNGRISPNAPSYIIYPLWDYVNLGLYNCAPFIFMMIFNSYTIYHLVHRRRERLIHQSAIHHQAISFTLILTTFLFLLMTIPATIVAAFFYTVPTTTLAKILDSALYTYHILSFPLYFLTFSAFRREVIHMVTCNKNRQRIAPSGTTGTGPAH